MRRVLTSLTIAVALVAVLVELLPGRSNAGNVIPKPGIQFCGVETENDSNFGPANGPFSFADRINIFDSDIVRGPDGTLYVTFTGADNHGGTLSGLMTVTGTISMNYSRIASVNLVSPPTRLQFLSVVQLPSVNVLPGPVLSGTGGSAIHFTPVGTFTGTTTANLTLCGLLGDP